MIAAYISLMIFLALITIFFGIATTEETKSIATNNEENLQSYDDDNTIDKFGIKKMYPTTQGGREWYIDMINPKSDGIFSITSNYNITKQRDASWRIDAPMVRMNIDTLPGVEPWKNIEITGYAKVVSKSSSSNNTDLDWSARGGRQNSSIPCEGTALHGGLHIDGSVGWKKEIWQVGGYTAERAKAKILTDSILGRWIGWKVVMYNINNDTAVKMESYIDNKNSNYWVKVADLVDNGGWFANSPDNIFYSANCGKAKDYIITNGGSIVTFRSDNLVWDFKNLSVREIIPEEKIYNQP
ncbi:MAG TPA: hypothetical protein VE818_05530 [Nitrososphaeraceae archaeon]|jgi:hypothetical protein|nr:hypothetical protein [Nitrososphaeraceae archaeon]